MRPAPLVFHGSEDPWSHAFGGSGSEDPRTQWAVGPVNRYSRIVAPTDLSTWPRIRRRSFFTSRSRRVRFGARKVRW